MNSNSCLCLAYTSIVTRIKGLKKVFIIKSFQFA